MIMKKAKVSMTMTDALKAKAIKLHSTSIDSPTGRVSKNETLADGTPKPITPTLYFDKPVEVDGKLVPSKKSTLYTPNAAEAAELKATCDGCESVMLDGAGKYDPENKLHFRFLKTALTSNDMAEIKDIKGKLKAMNELAKIREDLKAITSQYIMGLPKDNKSMIADKLAEMTAVTLSILRNDAIDEEDEPLFS